MNKVEALFKQVEDDRGHLDVLVNNAWDGYERYEDFEVPFWEQPRWRWDSMFDAGVQAQ